MAKVTVLMAVYNAEQWLPKSLESLLNQTHRDIQIVCVDDCSSDHSLEILNNYAKRDARIEVVHSESNLGISKTRNIALKRAKGEYICMLDADDWFSPDAFEKALTIFELHPLADVVLFRLIMAYNDYMEDFPSLSFDVLKGKDACRLSLTWKIHGLYLVRASIHKQYPYDETCKLYSDENTTRIHYAMSREVYPSQGTYYYRQHPVSMTHKVSVHYFDKLAAKESLGSQLIGLHCKEEADAVINMLWLEVIDCYMFYHVHGKELTEEERRYGLSELHRVWQTIDRSMLNKETIAKFGYRPCWSWPLFRLQEWLYFTLRGFLGKNH